jgi:hypothetical protein
MVKINRKGANRIVTTTMKGVGIHALTSSYFNTSKRNNNGKKKRNDETTGKNKQTNASATGGMYFFSERKLSCRRTFVFGQEVATAVGSTKASSDRTCVGPIQTLSSKLSFITITSSLDGSVDDGSQSCQQGDFNFLRCQKLYLLNRSVLNR